MSFLITCGTDGPDAFASGSPNLIAGFFVGVTGELVETSLDIYKEVKSE